MGRAQAHSRATGKASVILSVEMNMGLYGGFLIPLPSFALPEHRLASQHAHLSLCPSKPEDLGLILAQTIRAGPSLISKQN